MPLYATTEDMASDRKNGGLVIDDDEEKGEERGAGKGKGDEEEQRQGHGQEQGHGQGEGKKKKSRRSTGEDAAALSLFCSTPKVRTTNHITSHKSVYGNICVYFHLFTKRQKTLCAVLCCAVM